MTLFNLFRVSTGFVCTSCIESSEAALSDKSACMACGVSTEGLEDGGTECSCPVGEHVNLNPRKCSWMCVYFLASRQLHANDCCWYRSVGVQHLAVLC